LSSEGLSGRLKEVGPPLIEEGARRCKPVCKPDSVEDDSLTCPDGAVLASDLGKRSLPRSIRFYGFLPGSVVSRGMDAE
jgi:hypothetical protein